MALLTLPHMFAADEPLVVSVVEQLRQMAEAPSLSKLQSLTRQQVSSALEVAFWASLRSNEGRPTRVRLLFAEPELLQDPIRFAKAVPYAPLELAKLTPAVPEGGCIGVSAAHEAALEVWGLHPTDPGSSLHALGLWMPLPGVVHVRIGPLRPYAVISDGEAALLANAALTLPEQLRLRLGKSLTSGDIHASQAAWRECLLLAALARRVLHRGHGGTLLLVPPDGAWQSGVELGHAFSAPDVALRDAARRGPGDPHGPVVDERAALMRVAPYASVDGAVVITRSLEVLGFGAKIVVPADAVNEVLIAGPQASVSREDLQPIAQTGGTRHQSAARFVGATRDCVAIVISHDGHISLFFWEEALEAVRMIRNVDWWD
jgi:hypothetical protein